MFDDIQKSEYSSIKAPSHLQKRITNTLTVRRIEPRIVSAAACIVLIAVMTVFSFGLLTPKTVSVSYMGEPIGSQEISVSGSQARAVNFGEKTITPTGIPLYVTAVKDTKISVSGGSIQIFDEKGELLLVGTDLTLDTSGEIRWDVSDLPTGSYTLSLGAQTYQVRIQTENGEMTIFKSEKE